MSTTRSLVTALTRLHMAALFGSPPATARVAVTGEVDLAPLACHPRGPRRAFRWEG